MTPRIQEWIYKFEVGEGTQTLRRVTACLALIALAVLYDLREFKNFATPESMDTAQLARNISEGRGFTTRFIRPLSVHMVRERLAATGQDPNLALKRPHPDLANAPLYPVLLAGAMKVLPFEFAIAPGTEKNFRIYQPEMLIAIVNQLLFGVAIWMVFRLARRLFDPGVAWVATIVFAGADLLWRFTVAGTSVFLVLILWLAVVGLLVGLEAALREEAPRPAGWFVRRALLVGLCLGLGALTRYAFGWLLIPVTIYYAVYFGAHRLRVAGATVLMFILVLSPWLARNYQASGRLFGTAGLTVISDTERFPGNRLERCLDPAFNQVEIQHCIHKLAVNAADLMRNEVPRLGGSWVAALFLAGLLVPFRNPALSRLRVLTLLAGLTLIPAQALGQTHLAAAAPEVNSENYLVWLSPLVFIYGTGMFFLLLDHVEFPFPPVRTLVQGVFSVLGCVSLVFTLLPPRSFPYPFPPVYWPPLVQQLSHWMGERELMMSDMPWAVAWYGQRPCLWTVLDVERDFYAINDYQHPIQALYLTRLTTDARFYSEMLGAPDRGWEWFVVQSLVRTNLPPRWPLLRSVRGLMEGQVYLTDTDRMSRPPSR
jgi:hypothetical protein